MQIKTKYLGEVIIKEEDIISFPTGIPGFVEETKFTILDFPGNETFQFLQSVHTPGLVFVITDPYQFMKAYTFKLDQTFLEQLHIRHEGDVVVRSIVTLREPFSESTLNLKGPLIINAQKNIGKQYIINEDDFPVKAPISSFLISKGGEA
ncbi:flagellar assembly protein FliW [Virgibacillus soli]